ncbi:MAG: hypothetical protein DSY58_01425 [Desulfobulbus sp.]|nr:MAG: hypothetical protein DSY58_01425 [Desulfobulbus sp.]
MRLNNLTYQKTLKIRPLKKESDYLSCIISAVTESINLILPEKHRADTEEERTRITPHTRYKDVLGSLQIS